MSLLHNRALWRYILGIMLVSLAFVAFWPRPVDQPVRGHLVDLIIVLQASGIPRWFNYEFIEASANVGLFIPLGIVSCLAFPEKRWWHVGTLGLLISGCMELGQLLFLHNRFASLLDLMTNTSGSFIGALLAAITIRRMKVCDLYAADPQIKR